MTPRLILPLFVVGALARAGVPTPVSLLWSQVAFVPPGTSGAVRTDVIGGAVVGAGPAAVGPGSAVPVGGGAGASVGVPVGGAAGAPGLGSGRAGTSSPAGGANTRGDSGSSAAGTSLEDPACSAVVSSGEYPVSAFGGVVELRVQLKPPGCKPVLGSSGNWLLLAAGPQTGDVYRFSVAPNLSNSPRTGVVVIGAQKILIRQAANGGSRFAASPGHVSLSVNSDRAPSPRVVTIFSDDKSLTYSVTASQPWLRAAPVKGSAPGAQRFQITVDPGKLRRGRNEGFVRITATGQLSAPLDVPVVVEVPRVR